ncbi:hypothetical protein DV517_15570 [Streptomyces sp. S816]|uniref:DUF2637 domain-containing protein n=1 Tax=Streptomyces sp. S816 TaxID=2283197 RepID=UPI00109D0B56|nr:DUF2637 domain-containing protein [Streptomyces sp. S816]TGZ16584.1 hypothetical protein DV517_15570 [Streptomyces sp. S816]
MECFRLTPRTAVTASSAIPGSSAIRFGIALLGAIGFALSYDALRQMAVAIHIRGMLTYAFPLVIDGFIAIGVGALLILRTAPLLSRLYVWALVGLATATSIWANALHAVRLNQQTGPDGLHLDDITVGVLSAIAPLALAGAVHLYIVIRRHPMTDAQEVSAAARHTPADHSHNGTDGAQLAAPVEEDPYRPDPLALEVTDGHIDVARVSADVTQGAANSPELPPPSTEPEAQKPRAVSDDLLAIARTAPLGRGGRASRRHIEDAIRGEGLTIGKAEAETIKKALQAELDEAATQEQTELAKVPAGAF